MTTITNSYSHKHYRKTKIRGKNLKVCWLKTGDPCMEVKWNEKISRLWGTNEIHWSGSAALCIKTGHSIFPVLRREATVARPMTELQKLHCIIMWACALTLRCRHSGLLHQLINTLWNDITHIMRFQCANDFVISCWPSLLFVNIPNCVSQLSLNGLPP